MLLAAEEKGVLNRDLCSRVGGMGELPVHADVTRCVDTGVRGPERVVDADSAAGVEFDANRFEAHSPDVGRSAHPDENLVDGDRPGPPICIGDLDHLLPG